MKTDILLLALAMLCASSCELFEYDTSFGLPHKYNQRYGQRDRAESDSTDTGPIHKTRLDTAIYISGVRVPKGYDWQRDTAYGAVDAELVLLRNFKEIVSIPVSSKVSAAADKHFIYGGHLYTERQSSSATHIGCDGTELLTTAGRDELKGILEHDGVLYLMTSPVGNEGFTLWADGSVVLMKNDGHVYGSLIMPSYRPGGALYMNNGKCSFCCSSGGSSYKVENGVESVISSATQNAHDVKVIGNLEIAVDEHFRNLGLVDARIWSQENGYAVSGTDKYSDLPIICRSGDSRAVSIPIIGVNAIYVNDDHIYAVGCSREGKVKWADVNKCHEEEGTWYFFSSSCATIGPSGLALVLTPKEKGEKPVLLYDGKFREIDFDGFLTGIRIEIEEK